MKTDDGMSSEELMVDIKALLRDGLSEELTEDQIATIETFGNERIKDQRIIVAEDLDQGTTWAELAERIRKRGA